METPIVHICMHKVKTRRPKVDDSHCYFLLNFGKYQIQELDTLLCVFFTKTYIVMQVNYVSLMLAKHHDSVLLFVIKM